MKEVRALILSAGLGTRLRPITDTIPKALVPINSKPLLDIWLDLLDAAGIRKILINTHYFAEQIEQHVAASPYRDAITTTYEETLLNTGGTLLANRDFFGDADILLIHGDNLSRFDLQAMVRRHNERPPECKMTMMLFRTDNPSSCGIVTLDEREVVVDFQEKPDQPQSDLANGAVYILAPELMDRLAALDKTEIDFSLEIIPELMGQIYTFRNDDYHRDIGTPESYARAQKEFY